MNKQAFITGLRAKLSGLPRRDVEERLSFYCEMIDDRMEEGLSEEDAVLQIGSLDEIAAQIMTDVSLAQKVKKEFDPKRKMRAWEIVLLVLGSPIWVSLLIAAFAVILSLYAVLWSLIFSLWAVFASLIACAFGGVVAGGFFICHSNALTGVAIIGASIVCAGLSVFLFFGCKAATKGSVWLTKKIALGIKKCFVGKEKTS